MGTYIGAFELVVWSALRNVKVGLVVGGSIHQMREVFTPALPEPPDSAGTHHLVACNLGDPWDFASGGHVRASSKLPPLRRRSTSAWAFARVH